MLFVNQEIKTEEINKINNFFAELNNEFEAVETVEEEKVTTISKYITSLVSSQYQKSVKDINGTTTSNRAKRRRNLQQVMQESFFYGANRFGNNFIA